MSGLSELDLAIAPADLNREPQAAFIIALDCSASMSLPDDAPKIDALAKVMPRFRAVGQTDKIAEVRADVTILGFPALTGTGAVETLVDWSRLSAIPDLPLRTDKAGYGTPLGAAVLAALGIARDRLAHYKTAQQPKFRPVIFFVTDGEPTDEVAEAARQIAEARQNKLVSMFAIHIKEPGGGAAADAANRTNFRNLEGLFGADYVKAVDEANIAEVVKWLSLSVKTVSNSPASSAGADAGGQPGTRLPPTDDWEAKPWDA